MFQLSFGIQYLDLSTDVSTFGSILDYGFCTNKWFSNPLYEFAFWL